MHRTDTSSAYVSEVAAALSCSPDTFQVQYASDAYAANCPAYLDRWAGRHHGDRLTQLVDYANTHGGLNGAQRALGVKHVTIDNLDNLVPLNLKAVKELSVIYADLGTFRERNELLDRNPMFTLAQSSHVDTFEVAASKSEAA